MISSARSGTPDTLPTWMTNGGNGVQVKHHCNE